MKPKNYSFLLIMAGSFFAERLRESSLLKPGISVLEPKSGNLIGQPNSVLDKRCLEPFFG